MIIKGDEREAEKIALENKWMMDKSSAEEGNAVVDRIFDEEQEKVRQMIEDDAAKAL